MSECTVHKSFKLTLSVIVEISTFRLERFTSECVSDGHLCLGVYLVTFVNPLPPPLSPTSV